VRHGYALYSGQPQTARRAGLHTLFLGNKVLHPNVYLLRAYDLLEIEKQ